MVVDQFPYSAETATSTASTHGRKSDGENVDGETRFELDSIIVLLES